MLRKKKQRAPNRAGKVIAGVAGMVILVALTYFQLRPAVQYAAAYQANVFATRLINAAVLEQLASQDIAYTDFVRLSRSAGGEIVAIESDMAGINRLKANVALSVANTLEQMGTVSLRVPLGTLIGNEITAGRGPLVEIRVYPIGYVQTELYSQFTQAGINQTLHQIMLNVGVRMRAVVPGYQIQTDAGASYGIAETVIVGATPEFYANINLDTLPTIARIGG